MRNLLVPVIFAAASFIWGSQTALAGASDLMGSLTSQLGGAATSQVAEAVAPTPATDSGLVSSLTSQLGVTEAQAIGGSGAILGLAKDRMSPGDFGQVSDAVPGMDSLLAAAPAVGGSSGGGLLGAAGALGAVGGMGSLGSLASLAGPFSDLGMSPDMVTKFVPVILDYVQSTGGDTVMGLLKNSLM